MADGLQLRQDTTANWAASDPTLSLYEEGWDTDLDMGKMGDGVTAWSTLSFTLRKVYVGTSAPSNHNWIWIDTT